MEADILKAITVNNNLAKEGEPRTSQTTKQEAHVELEDMELKLETMRKLHQL